MDKVFYKSLRVGKGGKKFFLIKFRTLKEGFSEVFVNDEGYTKWGKFLRRTKLDELPQLINVLKGDMKVFSYRPEEEKTFNVLPENMKQILLKEKPGLIDLSSLYFIDEEEILRQSPDIFKTYWKDIRPVKFLLQCFYIENKCWLLNLAILWLTFKRILKSLWKG